MHIIPVANTASLVTRQADSALPISVLSRNQISLCFVSRVKPFYTTHTETLKLIRHVKEVETRALVADLQKVGAWAQRYRDGIRL